MCEYWGYWRSAARRWSVVWVWDGLSALPSWFLSIMFWRLWTIYARCEVFSFHVVFLLYTSVLFSELGHETNNSRPDPKIWITTTIEYVCAIIWQYSECQIPIKCTDRQVNANSRMSYMIWPIQYRFRTILIRVVPDLLFLNPAGAGFCRI